MNRTYFYVWLLCIGCVLAASNTLKFAIKIPTRSRPQQFFDVLDSYYAHLSQQLSYQFIISCDEDDATMNNQECRERLAKYPHLYVSFKPRSSKIEAYNRDLELFDFDILLVASDDAIPTMQHYDLLIAKTMQDVFPDYDGVINFNDGYVKGQCNTLPVIGKKYFDRFGYVYHPAYKALACDVEFTLVSRVLGKEHISNEVPIMHNHYGHIRALPDALYMENERWHSVDLTELYARYARRFDLAESSLDALCTKRWTILVTMFQPEAYVQKLQKQIEDLNAQDVIEILVDSSAMPEGYRRNVLLGASRGIYVSFIDDTVSAISDKYVCAIYQVIMQDLNQDMIVIFDNEKYQDYRKFLKYLNPIKRSIIALSTFPDNEKITNGWYGILQRSGLLKTEVRLEHNSLIDV